jgi:hypothetical protein
MAGSERSGRVKRCGFWHTPFGKLKPKARILTIMSGLASRALQGHAVFKKVSNSFELDATP